MRKHDDLVHRVEPHQPVRDDEQRAIGHQLEDRRHDLPFHQRVQVGRGLIQDEDGRVLQQGTGNRQALTLSSTQPQPLLPDPRVIPLGQTHDEIVNLSPLRGGHKFFLRRVGLGQQQVVTHRAVEQVCTLGDHTDEPPHVVLVIGA